MLSKPAKVYPLSLAERNSLDMWINEELRKGYIQPSTSPIAAPFFFVKKHNRSLQSVIDYRALNRIIIKNRYLIPRIADLIESLSKALIFTKKLTWGGDITMFISKKGMNGRQHLLQDKAFLRQLSCILVFPMHQWPSKAWWMIYWETWFAYD